MATSSMLPARAGVMLRLTKRIQLRMAHQQLPAVRQRALAVQAAWRVHSTAASTAQRAQQQRQQRMWERVRPLATLAEAPAAATEEGEQEAEALEALVLDVRGMKCGGCSAAVKRMLLKEPGVQSAAVNLLTETAVVQYRGSTPEEMAARASQVLTGKGFPAAVRQADGASGRNTAEAQQRRQAEERASNINLAVAWGLVLLCCTHHVGHLLHSLGYHQFAHGPFMDLLGSPGVSGALGAFALLGPGRQLLIDGFRALWLGNPNMNSLVGIGSSASFLVGGAAALVPSLGFDASFLEEPVMLLAFVLLGRALEARAKVKAVSDLQALAHLIPDNARLVLDPGAPPGATPSASHAGAELLQVPTRTIRRGDVLRVLPGERIPVDGEVLEGASAVDEAALTGESVLVAKGPGAAVAGGTVNYEGPITVRATATGADSTLAGIGRLVADAQSREAPVQRLADAVAGKFCYGVMAASAATFTFWNFAGVDLFPSALDALPDTIAPSSGALLLSIRLAVDVLVVACPCALGLATPTAVLVASSMGATKGLLMRGGDVLEKLAGVDTVVLDKTGTLTQGRMQLGSVAVAGEAAAAVGAAEAEAQLLRVAAAVEATTRHPIADAVAAGAAARGLVLPSVSEASTEAGAGVRAVVEGASVLVGRRDWVLQQLHDASSAQQVAESLQAGSQERQTHVYVAADGKLLGALGFKDTLRTDAVRTVSELKRMGMQVHMLSGDDPATVRAVAAQAGIDPALCRGAMSPSDKMRVVQELQANGAKVAMVGDGVNDAPALATAHVGVALKGGLDAAGEAASVVLMGDRLSQVLDSLSLGRATLSKIKQNLAWALVYNVLGIPLAAGALLPSMGLALNPSAAGAMMAFSSLAVVSNSLLLRTQQGGSAVQQQSGSGQQQGGSAGVTV